MFRLYSDSPAASGASALVPKISTRSTPSAPEAIHPDGIALDGHAAGSATGVEAVHGHHARIRIDQFDQVGAS
jgi:hypothetical protein